MYPTRPHERHELRTTTTTSMNDAHNVVHALSQPTGQRVLHRLPVQLALLILGLASVQDVTATPMGSNGLRQRNLGDDGGSGMSMDKKIWIPVLVFAIFVFSLAVFRSRASLRRALSGFSLTGAAPTAGLATGAPRELTAEQLAGTINTGQSQAAPVTTRRARRPRRTPSQMSVTSLPAYNKEPGDEELVIFRGRDMEDAAMPTAVVRQSADNESSLSLDHSQVSRYSPMPASQNNVPLLNPNDPYEGDLSMQHLPISEDQDERPSPTSNADSHEMSSLMRAETNNSTDSAPAVAEPDPRGEAPPYFEVVELESPEYNTPSQSTSPEPTPAETDAAPASMNRRSGFRSLLNRMSIVSHAPTPPAPVRHARNDSSGSALSALSHGRDSTSRASHRTTNSIFRTLSRQRSTHTLSSMRPSSPNASNARLTSPSMISLHSISAPLSHTLTRTEFTYPKTGPTPEQLRVISSREHVSRFGVPYGEEAVRFASTSRVDLDSMGPPPEFDEAVAGLPTPSGSGPRPVHQSAGEGSSEIDTIPPTQSSSPPATIPQPGHADTDASSSEPQGLSTITPKTRNSQSAYASSTVTSTTSTVKPSQPASEFGALLSPSSDPHASVRSTASYATAIESLGLSARSEQPSLTSPTGSASFSRRSRDPSVSASDTEDFYDAEDGEAGSEIGYQSALTTPRMGGGHVLEPTDATVVPVREDVAAR